MADAATSIVKDQHYIPKFYLKGFTDKDGVLWVCEKFKPIRSSRPKAEAHRPDYYTHAEGGQRDETTEDILKETESRVAPIIRKLASPQYILTPENAGHLFVFIAFMFTRVPSWRDNMNGLAARTAKHTVVRNAADKERFHRSCKEFERRRGKTLGMDYEELRQFVLKGDYEILQQSVAFNLGLMLLLAFDLIDTLRSFGYVRLYAPEGSCFLTSDAPVFTILPDGKGQASVGIGFGWPGVEVYFPLNKRACLMLKNGIRAESCQIPPKYLKQINRMTMINSARYLYSSERYRSIVRQFNQYGCRVRPGKESFLPTLPAMDRIL